MKKIINDKSGSTYIELMVAMLIIFMILAIIISVLPIFFAKAKLSDYTDDIMRIAEIAGETNYSAINTMVTELNAEMGGTATLNWNGTDYFNGRKVQLGDTIELEVSIPYRIEGLSFLGQSMDFTIKARATGMSEVYWRN